MPKRNVGPRAEHRQQERQRASESDTLAAKFPGLRSLVVHLAFVDAERRGATGRIKYHVNIANAKSVFCIDCPNGECVGGDFDLSAELTNAYADRQTTAQGECHCKGWRSKTTVGTVRCAHTLIYQLSLEYQDATPSRA